MNAFFPASEATFTMSPDLCFIICGNTAREQRNTPRTLTSHMRSKSSGVMSTTLLKTPMPALFTRMSILPYRSIADTMSRATCCSSDTSAGTTSAPLPRSSIAPATLSRVARVLAASTTSAPSRAKESATDFPIPFPAPVTIATLPFKLI